MRIGPTAAVGPLRPLHFVSTVVWLPLAAVHVFAYLQRAPRLIAGDWRSRPIKAAPGEEVSGGEAQGRGRRLGVTLGALLVGVLAAVLAYPLAAPWLAWVTTGEGGPGPLLAGTLFAILAARPLWRS